MSVTSKPPIVPFRLPGELLVGIGAVELLPEKVQELGGKRPLLISDRGVEAAGLVERVKGILERAGLAIDSYCEVHGEPLVETLEAAVRFVRDGGYDLVIGLGGGSSMDVAKAAALVAPNTGGATQYVGVNLVPNRGLPTILLPTTSGTGSEVTPNAIFTDPEARVKRGMVSRFLLATVSIVDPGLTMGAPPELTASTGMDALTHAVESFVSPKATVHTEIYAIRAVELISETLGRAVENGRDEQARTGMAWGSMLAGVSLANAGVGAVHALAYPLGGQFGIPHGIANALLLPFVLEYNVSANYPKFAEIGRAMGVTDVEVTEEVARLGVKAIRQLSEDVNIPQRLRELKIPREAIPKMAEAACKISRLLANNPRPMTTEDILEVYTKAW